MNKIELLTLIPTTTKVKRIGTDEMYIYRGQNQGATDHAGLHNLRPIGNELDTDKLHNTDYLMKNFKIDRETAITNVTCTLMDTVRRVKQECRLCPKCACKNDLGDGYVCAASMLHQDQVHADLIKLKAVLDAAFEIDEDFRHDLMCALEMGYISEFGNNNPDDWVTNITAEKEVKNLCMLYLVFEGDN